MKLKDYIKEMSEQLEANQFLGELEVLTHDHDAYVMPTDYVLGWWADGMWTGEESGIKPPKDMALNAMMIG